MDLSNIKVLVFDLDGTLFHYGKQITPSVKEKIIEYQKNGYIVGIATGRFFSELDEIIKDLKLREYKGFVACANGLEVHDFYDQRVRMFPRIPSKDVKEVIRIAQQHLLVPYFWEEEHYVMFLPKVLKKGQAILKKIYRNPVHHKLAPLVLTEIRTKIKTQSNLYDKVCFVGRKGDVARFEKDILKRYPDYRFYPVDDRSTELVAKQVGKKEAVEWVVRKHNYTLDNVLAFGDSGNDLPLLLASGIGIAMKNAQPHVKKAVQYITKYKNSDNGVFHHLESLALGSIVSVDQSRTDKQEDSGNDKSGTN